MTRTSTPGRLADLIREMLDDGNKYSTGQILRRYPDEHASSVHRTLRRMVDTGELKTWMDYPDQHGSITNHRWYQYPPP